MASIATATLVSEATGDMRFPTGEVGDKAATLDQAHWLFTRSYNVLNEGLVADGVTNNSAALVALIATATSGDTIIFPYGTYLFNSVVTLNKRLNFVGYSSIIKAGYNGSVFTVTANYCNFTGLRFLGSGKDEGSTLQTGLTFDSCGLFNVVNCQFYGLAGNGLYFEQTSISGSLGGSIVSCAFDSNNYGIKSGATGEYGMITSCNINNNNFGLSLIGGNVTINGCNINYNLIGLEILTGGNNAHGIISNCNINHNVSYNLKLHEFSIGQTISACHLYEGDIWLKNTYSVVFQSCIIDVTNIYFENSENTIFENCSFDDAYATTVNNNYNATSSTTNYFRCHHVDGRIATDPITFYVGLQSDSIVVPDAEAFYLGDPSADGSWRIIRSGNNLLRQRREAAAWVTKATDTP